MEILAYITEHFLFYFVELLSLIPFSLLFSTLLPSFLLLFYLLPTPIFLFLICLPFHLSPPSFSFPPILTLLSLVSFSHFTFSYSFLYHILFYFLLLFNFHFLLLILLYLVGQKVCLISEYAVQ